MVKFSQTSSFPGLPITERGVALVLGPDPKGKNYLYCSRTAVVIRDIENLKDNDFFYGHQKQPSCAKYSPSGFYVCSGDAGGFVKIWDTTQKEHITKYEYQPLSSKISDISWDEDSKRIAVVGQGPGKYGHVFLWDSGSSTGTINMISKKANSVDIKPKRPYRLAAASDDYNTCFYEGPPFKYKKNHAGANFAQCVRFSPDGKYLVSCNSSGHIEMFCGKTFDWLGRFGDPNATELNRKAHNGTVMCASFSPDGSELLSASADKTCKIWNVESREMVVHFTFGKEIADQQMSCLWQKDHLLSVSCSGEINYLDRKNPSNPSRVISGHNCGITAMATKHNEAIFTADSKGFVVKWNPETGEGSRFVGKGHGAKIVAMKYVASTNQLVSVGLDNKVRFTSCDTCEFSPDSVIPLDSEPSGLSISDDYIVVACQKELVLIKDGKKLSSLSWDNENTTQATVFGQTIFATGKKTTGLNYVEIQPCTLYDIEGDSIVKSSSPVSATHNVSMVAISPDGARLAVLDAKDTLIFEIADGFKNPSKSFGGHATNLKNLAWSPDSRCLATTASDGSLLVRDVDKGSTKSMLHAHPKSIITSMDWLNENTLVTVAQDDTVKQWTVTFE